MINFKKIIILIILNLIFSGCATITEQAIYSGENLDKRMRQQGYDNCLTLQNSEEYCTNEWKR